MMNICALCEKCWPRHTKIQSTFCKIFWMRSSFYYRSTASTVWPSYLLEWFGEMQYTCDLISNNKYYFRTDSVTTKINCHCLRMQSNERPHHYYSRREPVSSRTSKTPDPTGIAKEQTSLIIISLPAPQFLKL